MNKMKRHHGKLMAAAVLAGLLLSACATNPTTETSANEASTSQVTYSKSRALKQAIKDIEAGRLEQAIELLQARTDAAPDDVLAWNALGVAQREQGDFALAKQAYQKAAALDASAAMAYKNLGILHDLYLHDPISALPYYQTAAKLLPDDALLAKWVVEVERRAKKMGGTP